LTSPCGIKAGIKDEGAGLFSRREGREEGRRVEREKKKDEKRLTAPVVILKVAFALGDREMRYCLSGLCLKRVEEQLELRSTETKGGRFRRTPNQGRKRDSHSRRLPFKPSLPSSWIDFSVLDSISFRRREKLELLSSSRDRTTPGYGGWDEGGRVVAIEEGHLIQPKREDGESECQKEKMKKDWSSKGKRDASFHFSSTHPWYGFQILVPESPIGFLQNTLVVLPELVLLGRPWFLRIVDSLLQLVDDSNPRNRKPLESDIFLVVVSFDEEDLPPNVVLDDLGCSSMASDVGMSRIHLASHRQRISLFKINVVSSSSQRERRDEGGMKPTPNQKGIRCG